MNQRIFVLFAFLLTACVSAPASSTATLPPPIITIIRATGTPTSIPVIETPTIVPTPTASPHLMYPYTIAGLRERTFSGGEIQILQILLQAQTYTRYLISYPSDGLTITGILQIRQGGTFPVIVMNHGFAKRSEYTSGDGTDRAAAYLVERGYITIAS
ncbi:MAG: hypothetical protein IPN58_18145, partial [Anaerolineales bacterium]|nr:hypothetical protein [Anaerolineales bacterium]